MTTMPMDPITAQRMLERLPEIQRRQRRAKRLREQQGRLDEMAQTKMGGGQWTPTTRGALYDIQGTYIPDYASIGDRLVGGIGGFLGGRKLEREEEELAGQLNPEILETVQDLSRELPEGEKRTGPTEQTLRAYLGMLGGPEMKPEDIMGKARRLVKTEILDTGEIVNVYSTGEREKTGDKAKYINRQWRNEATGEILNVPTSGSAGASTVDMGGVGTPPFNPNATPPGVPPPGGVVAPPPGSQVAPEDHMVQVGKFSVDMGGMPPEAVEQVRSTLENLAAANVPEAVIDQAAQAFAIKAQQMREMQPGMVGGQAVTSGAPPPAPSGPTPTEGAMAAGLGIQTPQQPARLPTAYEIAMDKERGKIAAQIGAAPEIAQAAADKETATRTATLQADAVASAKSAYPKAQAARRKAQAEVNRILSKPDVLAEIAGGSLTGRLSAVPYIGDELAKGYTGVFKGGSEAANAMAVMQTLGSAAFLQSYADSLKGTGQISNIEGLRAASANLQAALSQEPERIKERLQEFVAELKAVEDRLAEASSQGSAPAAPKLPQGWSVEVE